ncbi:MAG: hypothetical protein QM488_04620 [Rhizobiaceae bacterium]
MNRQKINQQSGNAEFLIGRREFLKISTLAAGWIVLTTNVAAGVWAVKEAAAAELPEGIKFMSAYDYQVMNRLMEVSLPTEGTPFPATGLPVMQVLDGALFGGMEPHILAGLKAGIKYFDAGPKENFNGKFFTELTDEEARRFCDIWADGEGDAQRGLAMGLKKLLGLAYWSNPAVWPALGYDGPYSRNAGVEQMGNAPMPS